MVGVEPTTSALRKLRSAIELHRRGGNNNYEGLVCKAAKGTAEVMRYCDGQRAGDGIYYFSLTGFHKDSIKLSKGVVHGSGRTDTGY